MDPEIQIQASYVGDQPLISALEGNLDPQMVRVFRAQHAVKAFIPIEVLIKAATIYALEKLVLEPLLNPIAERLDWVMAVGKFLRPQQPFNITIQIADNDFIEAPIGLDHKLVGGIWAIIGQTLSVLRSEGMLEDVSKIRITSDQRETPLIILYHGSKPFRQLLSSEGRTIPISDEGAISGKGR